MPRRFGCTILVVLLATPGLARPAAGRQGKPLHQAPPPAFSSSRGETTREYNQKLQQLLREAARPSGNPFAPDYRIGPEDLLEISVFEAPDLNRTVRVTADGEVSLPLLGSVHAAGLTSRELEVVLEEILRRTYMKGPHVSVFVKEMESHSVSVFGAVERPGVFRIRGAKTLIEVLSMAQGLASDAGDTVIVMRHGGLPPPALASPDANLAVTTDRQAASAKPGPSQAAAEEVSAAKSTKINLKDLLDSGDRRYNVLIYPGDVVKVARAGIVYVVGEVRKPGGFLLKTNENISVLQALALAEGLTRTSAAKHARIIRTDEASGERKGIPINLHRILAGKAPDPVLRSKDIVFVPNSTGRAAFYRGAEAAIGVASGIIVYRR